MQNDTEEGVFDADAFIQAEMDAPLDTKLSLFPEGDYEGAVLKEITRLRKITPKSKPDRPNPKPFAVADVIFTVPGLDGQAAELGRTVAEDGTVSFRGELMFDLDANGKMDAAKGRNIKLGQLRQMNGLNEPGQRFAMTMLHGTGPYTIRLGHEEDNRDKELPVDSRRKYERVVSWVRT